MKAIDAYTEHMMKKINESVAKLCPYEVDWLAKLMPKQSCKDGCKACWNKEIKEVKNERN